MNKQTQYTVAGQFGKAHGLDGALRLQALPAYLPSLLQAKVVFALQGGQPVPYFVEEVRSEQPLILKLEEVDSKEGVRLLSGQEVLLQNQDILPPPTEDEEEDELLALEGFMVDELSTGEIGRITAVVEYPQQIMAVLEYQDREVLLPLNETFILQIDPEGRRVLMDLPEGLLEL